ncbi:MAG TPA: hypothetical protein DCO78_02275, partial [Chitinophagaceae bacterium]|nr:hypothetical protein [Chitinophagaceae bacterium]
MNMKKTLLKLTLTFSLILLFGAGLFAQVTTSGISGKVTAGNNESLPGVTIIATHVPSGTTSGVITNADGRYTL